MQFHSNYIDALKEHYKDQEYKGSEWEKADKRNYHRFDTYTRSWYKISSLPDNANYKGYKIFHPTLKKYVPVEMHCEADWCDEELYIKSELNVKDYISRLKL